MTTDAPTAAPAQTTPTTATAGTPPAAAASHLAGRSALLNRTQLLADRPNTVTTVNLPDGTAVGVRTLTAGEREQWESLAFGDDGKPTRNAYRASLVAVAACDHAGTRLFADDDVAAIGGMAADTVIRIYEAAAKANGIGKAQEDAAVKN